MLAGVQQQPVSLQSKVAQNWEVLVAAAVAGLSVAGAQEPLEAIDQELQCYQEEVAGTSEAHRH